MEEVTYEVKLRGYNLEEWDIDDIICAGLQYYDDIQWRNLSSKVITIKEVEDIDPPEDN